MNHALDQLDQLIERAQNMLKIKMYMEQQSRLIQTLEEEAQYQFNRANKAEDYASILEKATSNLSEHFETQFRRAEALEDQVKQLTHTVNQLALYLLEDKTPRPLWFRQHLTELISK